MYRLVSGSESFFISLSSVQSRYPYRPSERGLHPPPVRLRASRNSRRKLWPALLRASFAPWRRVTGQIWRRKHIADVTGFQDSFGDLIPSPIFNP